MLCACLLQSQAAYAAGDQTAEDQTAEDQTGEDKTLVPVTEPSAEPLSAPASTAAPPALPSADAPSPAASLAAPSPSPAPSLTSQPAAVARGGSSWTLAEPVAGALTAFLPLVVGSLLLAQDDNPRLQRAGVTTILAGFAAGPWVGHAGSGRWGRAAAFGAASLAASAATWVVMEARDPFDPHLSNRKRLPFGFLFTAAFFFGAVGVADGFVVGPSRREP